MSNLDLTSIDFYEVDDQQFNYEPIPDGEYGLKLVNVAGKTSSAGTYGLGFEFSVNDGEFKNRKVFKDFWLTNVDSTKMKVMLGMFAGFLSNCGLEKEERHILFGDNYQPAQVYESLSGKIFTVQVGHRVYNEKTYNEFGKILGVSKSEIGF